jgi:predicted kinase
MTKSLILVRGIPGSGKTTFAEFLADDGSWPVLSADQFFEKNGKYEWKPELLPRAHEWCQTVVMKHMRMDFGKIFVANTFTTDSEMAPYISLANKFGYRVFTIIVENRHGNINVHDVPELTISKMKDRFSIKL